MNKTIYLIRHGESEVNKSKNHIKDNKKSKKMFKKSYIKSVGKFITSSMDSDLTLEGQGQAIKQGAYLKSLDFLETEGVELILHSPLKRAKDTCYFMFEEWTNVPFKEEPLLMEKNFSEYFYSDIKKRGKQLKDHIMSMKENSIVLVAHSRIFQAMIGQKVKIPNCSVWKINLSRDGEFSDLTKLYESVV